MNAALYDVTAGMMNEIQRQELIASNLAGANLAGFKGRHLVQPSFASELDAASNVAEAQAVTDFQQGELRQTGRALDLALVGSGFFLVNTSSGEEYLTRNGNFVVNADGVLTTQDGFEVAGIYGRIQYGAKDVLQTSQFAEDGSLRVWDSGNSPRDVGQVRLVQVQEPERLQRISANYFRKPEDVELSEAEGARVVNKHLEGANVMPVRAMATMIESLRKFEMGQKILEMNAQLSRQEQQSLQA